MSILTTATSTIAWTISRALSLIATLFILMAVLRVIDILTAVDSEQTSYLLAFIGLYVFIAFVLGIAVYYVEKLVK